LPSSKAKHHLDLRDWRIYMAESIDNAINNENCMGDTSKNAGLSKKVRVRHLADLDRRTLATQRVLRLTDALMSVLKEEASFEPGG
jgi:hypothetical protein